MHSRIFASFSGGRSSALMCKILLEQYKCAEIQFVFANTGQEHPKTLEFVDKCDKHYGLNLIWVEAVMHEGRVGTTHKLVTFETAARPTDKDNPYREMVKKYGIANKNFPHCTRELKLRPMYSYIQGLGWENYVVAMGIRGDEPKRLPKRDGEVDLGVGLEKGFLYPLAEAKISKADVLDYWANMPFDLEIPERAGNCLWCFKKSEKKHIENIERNREWYDFPAELEKHYSHLKIDSDSTPKPRWIFRGGRSTQELLAQVPVVEEKPTALPERWTACMDDGTAESCEPDFLDPESPIARNTA